MTIRRMKSDELDQVALLMSSSDPWVHFHYDFDECRTKLSLDGIKIDVATNDDGDFLGFVAFEDHGVGSAPELTYLCVAPASRNQGVGTALIVHFETELFPAAPNLFLFVSDVNQGAITLYKRLGYLQVGELTNYNFEGESELLFRKTRGPKRERLRRE